MIAACDVPLLWEYVSKKLIHIAVKDRIASRNKFRTVFSGINMEDFLKVSKPDTELQKQLGIDTSKHFVIGTIARLFYLKGHKYIIRCSPDIIKNHPEVKFLFVGDGLLRNRFETWIKKLGLSEHFIFTGLVPRHKIPQYLSIMDLVVHPSLSLQAFQESQIQKNP